MFKAIHTSNGYYLRAKNLSGKGRALMMKFDTGAVNTVISVEALTKRKIDKAWIVQSIQDKTPCRKFKSASGNEMTGYLVHVDNADIAGSRIERFYYYIMDLDFGIQEYIFLEDKAKLEKIDYADLDETAKLVYCFFDYLLFNKNYEFDLSAGSIEKYKEDATDYWKYLAQLLKLAGYK